MFVVCVYTQTHTHTHTYEKQKHTHTYTYTNASRNVCLPVSTVPWGVLIFGVAVYICVLYEIVCCKANPYKQIHTLTQQTQHTQKKQKMF